MYIPSSNFNEEQEQEVVCLLTGERYVYFEDSEKSIIDPKLLNGAIDVLPERFHYNPFVVHKGNGQVRVFGNFNK